MTLGDLRGRVSGGHDLLCSHFDRKAGTQLCSAMSTESSYEDGLKA